MHRLEVSIYCNMPLFELSRMQVDTVNIMHLLLFKISFLFVLTEKNLNNHVTKRHDDHQQNNTNIMLPAKTKWTYKALDKLIL
jgi:hypothetical protein